MPTSISPSTEATIQSPPAAAPSANVNWFAVPQNRYVAAGIAVAVIGLGTWLAVTSSRRKEEFAASKLNEARATAEAGNLPLAATELQKIISTFDGSDAATEAVITLNQVRLVNGQGELAVVGLQDFLKKHHEPKYVTPAYGLLGAALENAKRPADAAQAYLSASQTAELDYLKAEYLVEAGRAFVAAGNRDEAVKAYRKVLSDYGKTPLVTEATVRLAELTGGQL